MSLGGLRGGIGWGAWGDGDVIAEGAEGGEGASFAAIAVASVEVVATEVREWDVVQEHEVDRGDEGVGDGDDGALAAASGGEALVLGAEVAVLAATGGPGGLG